MKLPYELRRGLRAFQCLSLSERRASDNWRLTQAISTFAGLCWGDLQYRENHIQPWCLWDQQEAQSPYCGHTEGIELLVYTPVGSWRVARVNGFRCFSKSLIHQACTPAILRPGCSKKSTVTESTSGFLETLCCQGRSLLLPPP